MTPQLVRLSRAPAALLVLLAGGFLLSSCGDDDDNDAAPSRGGEGSSTSSAGGTAPTQGSRTAPNATAVPLVAGPSRRYSLLLDDLGTGNFRTDVKGTRELTADSYAEAPFWPSKQDGKDRLASWGYVDGYQTVLLPDGDINPAILNGAYVIRTETHLFKDAAGAAQAYQFFVKTVQTNGVSQAISGAPVGNESYASRTVQDKVPGSKVDQVLHHIVYLRGNVVAIVMTIGADPLMKIEITRDLALMIDQKVLGERPAPIPTPVSLPTPTPAPPIASRTPR